MITIMFRGFESENTARAMRRESAGSVGYRLSELCARAHDGFPAHRAADCPGAFGGTFGLDDDGHDDDSLG